MIAGFGNGVEDGAWNAWIGDMANANEILGLLHGFYGVGAVCAPAAATTMITKNGLQWFEFYYIMIGLAAIELAVSVAAFWTANAAAFRASRPSEATHRNNEGIAGTKDALKSKVTWICAWFLLFYVGIEVATGGWVVTFMIRVRHGGAFASGMTSTGFWLGITFGRVILGFVTPRVGEKLALTVYITASMALELLFWLIPQFYVSAVMVALLGFFLGPLFPAAVMGMTKLLPKRLHVSGIGFAAAFGAAGACILPFAVGAIAQAKGVKVLQPIVLALLVVDGALWLCLPLPMWVRKKKGGSKENQTGEDRER